MRVLFTINNLKSVGMKAVLVDLALRLRERGVNSAVAVGKLTDSRLERRLIEAGIPVLPVRLKIGNHESIYAWVTRLPRMCRWLRREFNSIHCFDYGRAVSEGIVVRISRRDWLVEKTNLIYSWGWAPRFLLASRIVCLSRAQQTLLGARWRRRLTRIPTGVQLSTYTCAEPLDRTEIGVPKDAFVFVSVAHLVPVKEHNLLFQAFSNLVSRSGGAFLVCAGTGNDAYRRQLEDLIDCLGIREYVRMLGAIDDVPGLLASSDAFVLSTRNDGRREGFGAAVVEAMAAGLPIIATRSGGPEDFVVPNQPGWLVSDTEDHLLSAMNACLSDEARRRRYGREGRNRAVCECDVDLMVSRYLDLYRSTTGTRS